MQLRRRHQRAFALPRFCRCLLTLTLRKVRSRVGSAQRLARLLRQALVERERDPCTHSETKTSSSFDSMLQCTSSQTAVEKLDSIRHRLLRCSPDCRIAKSSRPDLVWRIRRACGTLRSRGLLSRVADARRRPRPLRAGSLHADEGRQINARHR